ncbi:MAG: hypothetical protein K2N23_03440 [Clostridia bacterium]|nr:hypothetical protein [Clostridia bacterium]
MKKKLIAFAVGLLAFITCICCLTACAPAKTFEKAGMKITLTTSFHEKDLVSQTAYYESRTELVMALKEDFGSTGAGSYTLTQYTNMVMSNNKLSVEKFEREGKDYMYFSYEKSVSGKDFYYFVTTFKADDAFWLIQFACDSQYKNSKQNTFFKYADSVTFVVD